ncbi:protein disulfide-isomerase precursor [Rhizopus azygosporus]|uniref:protein disulfide-isomerase n=1 Tax=Rhizopus azygosporus TaxID=86630 RepID=A0A367JFJ2_RHIAZ|nr:protein disulfide-isomerase precursor [Rhizopus azygosporus]
MKLLGLVISTILTYAAAATTTHILHIDNESNFLDTIQSHKLVLVNFYVPDCEPCESIKPEYEKAAETLADSVRFAQVNCAESESICSAYRLKGYPTLQLFRRGKAVDVYSEEPKGIVNYVKSQMTFNIADIKTKAELEERKEKEPILIVAYVSPTDSVSIDQWKSISEEMMDDFAFALVTDDTLSATENISTLPTVVLYKHFDHLRDERKGDCKKQDIMDFIYINSVPLLGDITPKNFMDYVDAGRPLAYIFTDSLEMKNQMHELFLPLAEKYKDEFSFVHLNASQYPGQLELLSLDKQILPTLGIHNFKTGARYPFDQDVEFTLNRIDQFLSNIVDGGVEPVVKSQAFPQRSPDDTVHVVVGHEFNTVVFDRTKDVFIQIYAPWCRHSQQLAPIWQQLGDLVQSQDSGLVIAKMDGAVNDVPPSAGFQVKSYPTIKFVKAHTNEVVDYDGKRTLEDLVHFVNTHSSTVKLDLPVRHDEL